MYLFFAASEANLKTWGPKICENDQRPCDRSDVEHLDLVEVNLGGVRWIDGPERLNFQRHAMIKVPLVFGWAFLGGEILPFVLFGLWNIPL